MIITGGRVHKGRIAPDVARAGDDGPVSAPVSAVGPGPATPESRFQRGGAPRRDGDAHRVTDQDGVGQHHTGARPKVDSRALPARVLRQGIVPELRRGVSDVDSGALAVRLIVGNHIVVESGVIVPNNDPTASKLGPIVEDHVPGDDSRLPPGVYPDAGSIASPVFLDQVPTDG